MKKLCLLSVGIFALAIPCGAMAAEVIRVGDGGGNPDFVEGIWPAGSIVQVVAPVVVGNGSTLTIGAGTRVELNSGASLYVQGGGTLVSHGTEDAPVCFTAENTHRVLGDGSNSKMWEGLSVAGTADFVHTELLYGGTATQGLLTVRSGGTVRMDRSLVAHSSGVGIWNAGEFSGTNTAVYDTSIAGVYLDSPGAKGASHAQFTHCVIDCCELGVYQGGGDAVFANCDISDYRTYATTYLDGLVTFERCNFFSTRGIMLTASPLEATRPLQVNPCFVSPTNHDFHLAQESLLIDAGDAAAGMAADAFGNARTNAAHTTPTGTADANGMYPDIGLHEWQPTYTTEDVDICVMNIRMSATKAKTGDALTVMWTLLNVGSNAFSGTWTDEVTLVSRNGTPVKLGDISHTGTIEGMGALECSATFTIPAVPDQIWNVQVFANADGGVKEKMDPLHSAAGVKEDNGNISLEELTTQADIWNVASSLNVDIPPEAVRVYALAGLSSEGQSLKLNGSGDGWMAAGAYNVLPSDSYSWKSAKSGDGALWIWASEAPNESAAYLVLRNMGATSVSLLLEGGGEGMQIFRTDRTSVTISSNTSVTAEGIGLTAGVTGILQRVEGGGRYEAPLGGWDAVRRYAIFNLVGATTGTYRFGISDGIATTWMADEIVLHEAESGASFWTTTVLPIQGHPGIVYEGIVIYGNDGDADMWLPEFRVKAGSGGGTTVSATLDGPFEASIYLEGWSPTEPACVLKAGETCQVPFYYKALQAVDVNVVPDRLRSAEGYLALQASRDAQAEQADRQAEQAAILDNKPLSTGGNPGMTAGRIEGRLLMAGTDEPLPGIELVLRGTAGRSSLAGQGAESSDLMRWNEFGRTTTGADGSFVFEGLPVGSLFLFDSDMATLETMDEVQFDDYTQALLENCVVYVKERYYQLSGQVTGAGMPLADVTVRLESKNGWDETSTDEEGSWCFRNLAEGVYELQALPSQGFAQERTVQVDLTADAEVSLEMTRGGVIHAQAKDTATGEPIAGLWVLAYDISCEDNVEGGERSGSFTAHVMSDESGYLEFAGLLPGKYLFSSEDEAWEWIADLSAVEVSAESEQDVELQFSETCFYSAWPYFGAYPLLVEVDYHDEERIPEDIVQWAWDFNNDGLIDSTERDARYWYETNGVYDIVLTATMADGTTNEYRLSNGVEVVAPVPTVLQDNVIILAPTNTDYAYVSSVALGASQEMLMLRQLKDDPSQPIDVGTVFIIDEESHENGIPIVKVVTAEKTMDVWQLLTEEVTDIDEIFSSFQIVPTGDTLSQEGGGAAGPHKRGTSKAGGETRVWTSEDGKVRLDASYSAGEGNFKVSLSKIPTTGGIHFHFMWKRSFDFGLHLVVEPDAKGKVTWETNFLSADVGFDILELGVLGVRFEAKLTNTLNLTFSWKPGTEVDSYPKLQWTPEVRITRVPAYGAAEGGWRLSGPEAPKLVFEGGKNKWNLAGDIKATAEVYSEAKAAIKAQLKIIRTFDLLDIMNGKVWFKASAIMNANIAAERFDFDWATDYGAELNFLSFKDTILDDLFDIEWTLWHCPLTGPHKFNWPRLSWPFNGGGGKWFSWPDPLIPNFNFKLGSLFGGIPEFSWPGLSLDFPDWKVPQFPKFKWECGTLKFPDWDLSGLTSFKGWKFDLGSIPFPTIDLDLGLSLEAILKMPELPNFPNIPFYWPNAKDFDFSAPVIYLPHFKIPFRPKLVDFILPEMNASLPEWSGLGADLLNLPLELFVDWGDGSEKTELALSNGMALADVRKALSQALSHEYRIPGVYQAQAGIQFKYINALNKHVTFTIVVVNQDFDGDGMPNMWEALYSGSDGQKGLNPFSPDGAVDNDVDGLTNLQEFLAGTHPLEKDIDDDEMPDSFEVMYMVPPKGKSYTGLKPWKADGGADADGDGMSNADEYKYSQGGGDYGPGSTVDNYSSTNPMDPDTDKGGMKDGDEFEARDGKQRNLFNGEDDVKCCSDDCKQPEWDESAQKYVCGDIPDCKKKGKPENPGNCYEWKEDGKDENNCPKWKLEKKNNCPKDDDDDDDDDDAICKEIDQALCEYCAQCKDGWIQWAASHVRFTFKINCSPGAPSGVNGIISGLSSAGGGGSGGIGGTGGAYGSSGGGGALCGKDPDDDDDDPGDGGPPTPNVAGGRGAGKSAVYLITGDYVDAALDLPVRIGGTEGGVRRYLRNNEWSFREAASMLALAPGEGTEGTVAAGAGTLGVEWNGSGAPGAAAGLTNEATGVSLKSVPTGLWGVWEGTTQALIRVEYGLVGNHGTVTTNYGELVQAWRRAVEGGNDSAAAALESVATGGVVRVTSAEDAEGRRTSYEWNGSGLMTVAHFADGTQESYEYGSGNLMSGKTKRDGEHVGLTHDNFGYLTGLNNTKYEYTYDSGTKTYYAAIRYPDGRVGERWFDDTGAIIRHSMNGAVVYDEAAVKADALLTTKPAWPKETLNDAALPVTVEYRSGATEAFTWDGPGYQRSGVMEATGEELAWTYDGMGREMSSIRAGLAADVDRDAAGYVTRARLVSASGTETAEWDWDAAGNASEGRMGAWTRTNTYDLAGRVVSATTADGGAWAFTRDAEGRATAWTQPDGASGAKAYDGRGRLTWRRSPSGVETWWHHATNGLLTGWSNSLGRRVSYQYDKGERVAKATDEDGDVRTYEYDSAGNWRGLAPELRTFVNDGEGGLSLSVTNGGRVTTARRLWGTWFLRDVQANDQTWRLERNDEGQVTALVRAPMAGAPTTNSWAYDAAGRMTGWTDATGVSWSRGYDAAGFIAWETNGAGAGRSWTHDGTGRLTAVSDGAGRTSTFVYDPATGRTTTDLSDGSRLVSQSDAWGREIARTDAAGTLVATERRFDGAMLRRTWTAAGAELADLEATWSWDGDGQLLAQGMTGGPSTRFERTGSNRCERTVTSFGAFEAGAAVERDANGRVIAVTGADGERAECVWGDDGEVSGWMLPEGSVWFARDLTERTRTTLLPSGHLVTERTDLAGLVTNVSLSDADGMEAWSLALVRDAAGRIVSQEASTLAWDGAGRLVSVDGTSYARDAAGNRSGSGWTTEGMDRLAAWPGGTYGYDTNGAVVTRTCGAEELSFVRDLAGRVSEVRDATDGLVARFIYDADGRRLGKETADGDQKWYLWNGGRLAAELSGTGVVERVFGYWSEASRSPDWVRANGVLLVVLKDGFGVPTALVSALNGAVTEVNTGTTFGEGWACPMAPVWADGLLADAETGLMGGPDGRLYDPTTGRWLSPTPGTLEAGLNRYAREPAAVGTVREFPGLSMPGVDPEYDVLYAFARRCGADAETAATLARAELLLSLEARSDAAARSWVRQRDAATADAALRLVGEVPAGQFLCTRKGIESFLKSRRDVLEVTTELDAYGKLRSSMDLEEAFRLELAWSAGAEDRVSMGAWRGTWGWAGLHPEGCPATERWKALLLGAAHGERLSEENLEYLGEAKLFALSDWERSATPLDEEKAREKVDEALTELRRVLKSWANDECE